MSFFDWQWHGHGGCARDAFRKAVAEAEKTYGDSGYTGTIADKDHYVLVSQERLSLSDAEARLGEGLEDRYPDVCDSDAPAGCIPLDDGSYLFFGRSRT